MIFIIVTSKAIIISILNEPNQTTVLSSTKIMQNYLTHKYIQTIKYREIQICDINIVICKYPGICKG